MNFKYSMQEVDYLCNVGKKYSFLYFEVPKVASSTIKQTLQIAEGAIQPIKDIHDKESSSLFGLYDCGLEIDELFVTKNLFRFCFVRNPYTRVLSGYLDKIKDKRDPYWKQMRQKLGLEENSLPSFEEFLKAIQKQNINEIDLHWRPQSFILNVEEIGYDCVGKFEFFERDFCKVLHIIGINQNISTYDKHKTNADLLVDEFYTKNAVELVREIYQKDFQCFNYKTDISSVW